MADSKTNDICSFGEILIDFTGTGMTDSGVPLFAQHPGGAPANVAVGASRLGMKSSFIGKVGKDMHGEMLKNVLKKEGVNTDGLVEDPNVFTTLAFVSTDEQGERSFSFARKPGADTQIRFEEIDPDLVRNSKIFHAGSLSLTDSPAKETTLSLIETAKEAGTLFSYDPNYRASLWPDEETAIQEMRSLIPMADIMKISDEETVLMTGVRDPLQASSILLEEGPSIVAVTLGSEGALVANKSGHMLVKGFKSKVADTNGAGDSFWAGMLSSIAKSGMDLDELSLDDLELFTRFANGCAALTVRKAGAIPAMPTYAEVDALLKEEERS